MARGGECVQEIVKTMGGKEMTVGLREETDRFYNWMTKEEREERATTETKEEKERETKEARVKRVTKEAKVLRVTKEEKRQQIREEKGETKEGKEKGEEDRKGTGRVTQGTGNVRGLQRWTWERKPG